MNYIDIKEAVEITGKSEKTIRRLISKKESKSFIDIRNNKIFIDVNYLFSVYSPLNKAQNMGSQKVDTDQLGFSRIELIELKNKIALYEQEIKYKESLLNEKDNRIIDLQKTILLLELPSGKEDKPKKKWWKF